MSEKEKKPKKESKVKTQLRQFQQKTFDAFEELQDKIPSDISYTHKRVDNFIRLANEDKAPIQKIIVTMKRLPVVTHNDDGKAIKKDCLVVNSELHGKDWLGNKIPTVIDYFEGYHYEPEYTTRMTQNMETGEYEPNNDYQNNKKIYDIELTDSSNRKKIIGDIINKATGTYIDQIKFYYMVPDSTKGMGFPCALYTYDQFISSSLDEMEFLARTTPSPILHSIKDKKDYMQ